MMCGAVLATVLAVFAIPAWGNEFCTIDGITWEYSIGRNGAASLKGCSSLRSYMAVPASVDGHAVENIAFYMVLYDRTVTQIHLPATLKWLMTTNGNNPFANSYVLSSITVDANNPYFKSVDGVLYSKDGTQLFAVPAKRSGLTLPTNLTEIRVQAFQGCAIEAIAIPPSVKTIGMSAFSECKNLTAVNIPDGVTAIERGTFCWCRSLRSLTLPRSVTSIGSQAFYCCYGLETVEMFGRSVSLGSSAFGHCDSLSQIKYHGRRPIWAGELVGLQWNCVLYVGRRSFGWGVEIPGRYGDVAIEYLDEAEDVGGVVVDPKSWDYRDWFWKHFPEGKSGDEAAMLEQPAANPKYTIAEAFVAGLDPTDANAEFRAVMTFDEKGYPEVSWSPKLTKEEEAIREYVVLGKEKLTDPWSIVEWDAYRYNFFSVIVDLR